MSTRDEHAELHQHILAMIDAVYPNREVLYAFAWVVRDQLKDRDAIEPKDVHVTASAGMGHALLAFATACTVMPPHSVTAEATKQ